MCLCVCVCVCVCSGRANPCIRVAFIGFILQQCAQIFIVAGGPAGRSGITELNGTAQKLTLSRLRD